MELEEHCLKQYKFQCIQVVAMACVGVGMDVSEWFPVYVGLRQGCVMSVFT